MKVFIFWCSSEFGSHVKLVTYYWCAGLGEPSTDGAGAGHGRTHPQRQGRAGDCARVRTAGRPAIPPGTIYTSLAFSKLVTSLYYNHN